MGFDNSYMRTLKRSGDSFNGDKPSILHFFGFRYATDSSRYSQTVWISDSSSRTGQSAITGSHYDELEGYKRSSSPTGKAKELEDKFVSKAKQTCRYNSKDVLRNEYLDPAKMPPLPLSVQEYYDKHVHTPGESEATGGCIIGILLVAVWLILYHFFISRLIANTGLPAGLIHYGIPVVLFAIFYARGKAKEAEMLRKHGPKLPYEYLGAEEKEAQRQGYFEYMCKEYDTELGAILKEYAILKGYDRI